MSLSLPSKVLPGDAAYLFQQSCHPAKTPTLKALFSQPASTAFFKQYSVLANLCPTSRAQARIYSRCSVNLGCMSESMKWKKRIKKKVERRAKQEFERKARQLGHEGVRLPRPAQPSIKLPAPCRHGVPGPQPLPTCCRGLYLGSRSSPKGRGGMWCCRNRPGSSAACSRSTPVRGEGSPVSGPAGGGGLGKPRAA